MYKNVNEKKNGFLFVKELARKNLREQIRCSSCSKTTKEQKLRTKKLKLFGKSRSTWCTWMVVMITREPVNQPAPTARSQWALAFQFFFSLPIRIMATVILGMVLWNVAFTAREIVPQDGRRDRAVLTDHRLNYRPRKEALFLCLWFGLLSESCWDR